MATPKFSIETAGGCLAVNKKKMLRVYVRCTSLNGSSLNINLLIKWFGNGALLNTKSISQATGVTKQYDLEVSNAVYEAIQNGATRYTFSVSATNAGASLLSSGTFVLGAPKTM